MNQLELNSDLTVILNDVEQKLRALILKAGDGLAKVNGTVEPIVLELEDGVRASVQASLSAITRAGEAVNDIPSLISIARKLNGAFDGLRVEATKFEEAVVEEVHSLETEFHA